MKVVVIVISLLSISTYASVTDCRQFKLKTEYKNDDMAQTLVKMKARMEVLNGNATLEWTSGLTTFNWATDSDDGFFHVPNHDLKDVFNSYKKNVKTNAFNKLT